MITIDECEKRVSGMQSTMAKQMDSLKKEWEAKVNNLQTQLQSKSEELTSVQDKVINLTGELDKSKKELETTLSALKEKTNALDTLNSSVLKSSVELPTMKDGLAQCSTPAERVKFLTSGQYKKD